MGFIAPLFGAVGSFIGSLGIIGKAVIGIGFNFISAKIQQRNAKKNQKTVSGVQFDRDYGESVSRKVACGYNGIAAHDVYVNTYDSSNKRLEQLYVFSDFPCDGLSRIWAGGTLLTLSQTAADAVSVTYEVIDNDDYAGRMSFIFYFGVHTSADGGLVANANPTGRWTSAHVGHGVSYLIARLTYDQEKLASFPDFFFEIRGARLYDLRKDSSVGGVGSHRWGDYSTYEFTENPVIMDYNYRRGFVWGASASGRPDMFCGMGMDASDLPFVKYATAANICDEVVEGERRYRCSIMLDCGVEHRANIEGMMTSCGGMVIDSVDGSWPLIGTQQPIVFTFTDDDLVQDEPVRFQRKRSMAELVNSVGGTYPEPSNMWSPAGYDTQSNAAQVALDRRTRDIPINFETVPSKRQANQLASIYYNENRFEASGDVVLRPFFQDVQVGDWGQWISERFGTRTFVVPSREVRALTSDGPRNVALSLQERDGSIYAGAGTIAPVFPIPNGQPVYLNELQDWSIIPVLAQGPDGRTYPAFRMSWSPIDDVTVDGVQFRWWQKDAPNNKFSRSATARETILFIQEGVMGEETYVFEHILIAPTRVTNWSGQREATALDGGNGDLEVGLANLNRDVLDRFEEIQSDNKDAYRLIMETLTNFSLDGAIGEVQRQKMRAEVGKAFAQIIEERRVRVTADEALAEIIALLETEFDSNKASVATQITALSNADSSLAQSVQTLNVSVGNAQSAAGNAQNTANEVSANGLVKFTLSANQSGVDARYSVAIRGNIGATYKETGFFLELYTVSGVQRTRFAILADQFVVTDGGQYTLPMVFENGILKLQIANIGTVTAGLIMSSNGKVVFNLTSGFLSFSD